MQKNRIKNYLTLHLVVFVWGFTAILGALISLKAIPLVFFRMWLAVFFVGFFKVLTKKSFKTSFKGMLRFAITGIIIAVHWIAFFKSIKVSNISVALVTLSTGAFFTSLIEPVFFKRKVNWLEIFMGLLVVLGLYVIFNFDSQYTSGVLYALLAAFLSALFAVINGILIKEYKPVTISFYQLFFGVSALSIFIYCTTGFTPDFFNLKTLDWVYLSILSSVCTAWAFIASVKVMKYLTPYTVMLTVNLEPIYGIILALIIFGEKEKMEISFYIGAFIVLLVVLLNGLLKNTKIFKIKFKK